MTNLPAVPVFLDCTLRDGGYYNNWDFPVPVINQYLRTMKDVGVNWVELGLRSPSNDSFKGPCAYTTDDFIARLSLPEGLGVGVMMNASDLVVNGAYAENVLEALFPYPASETPVKLVRFACHVHEFVTILPAAKWLKERGFMVGYNLMQIADRSREEIENLALEATKWPVDVLYFADSMGSMSPDQASEIISYLRKHWHKDLGIHTHDNLGLALQNSLRAYSEGVTWIDSTVTGMGRGPGNCKTEYLALEIAALREQICNIVPLMGLIDSYFAPLQQACGWGTNPYYYLAGKYGIHPTYVQEMLSDSRYSDEDILSVMAYLRAEGGKKFSFNTLDMARHFFRGDPRGTWNPVELLQGRDILILGSGPGVKSHRDAIESYIRRHKPFVMALNTQSQLDQSLVSARIACHPIRLMADQAAHAKFPQPLMMPVSMLPPDLKQALGAKELLDYGLGIEKGAFAFHDTYSLVPNSLVLSYALAIATSGKANRIFLAGFDGYSSDDPRSEEIQDTFKAYLSNPAGLDIVSVTPTRYKLKTCSIYAM